jgi:hypothetical protein
VLDLVRRYPGAGSEETVQRVLDAVSAFEPTGRDDRTVLVLRTRSE